MPNYRASGIEKESAEAFLEVNSNNSVKVLLGDAVGGNTFQVDNTATTSVFSVDSQGNCNIAGDLTVQGSGLNTRLVSVFAEEGSALTNNDSEWSFGNGDVGTQRAVYIRYPGRILAVGLTCVGAPTSTANVECRIEDVNSVLDNLASVSLLAGNNRAKNDLTSGNSFSADRYIRFRTVTGGGASGGVVSALLELDIS